MKTKNNLLALFLILANLQVSLAQKIVLHLKGNQTCEYNISQLDSITFEEDTPVNKEEHECVDLALPSGTLWATCNVGADSPEKFGFFFAWGETEPKKTYFWNTYQYCHNSYNTLTKYCTIVNYGYKGFADNVIELDSMDDAATVIWGTSWQIPSREQYQELINSDYTITEWTTKNGINGCEITSRYNGNSIFIPAADYRQGTSISSANKRGYYWSRTLNKDLPDSAFYLYFMSDYYSDEVNLGSIGTGKQERYGGCPARPVRVISQ